MDCVATVSNNRFCRVTFSHDRRPELRTENAYAQSINVYCIMAYDRQERWRIQNFGSARLSTMLFVLKMVRGTKRGLGAGPQALSILIY